MLEIARERGFKGLVALRGDTGLALAQRVPSPTRSCSTCSSRHGRLALLDHLKRDPETRHIPVHIVSAARDGRQRALRAGAVAFLEKPVDEGAARGGVRGLASFIDRGVKRLLVVEDDETQRSRSSS